MAEWLYEAGIGEARAALVVDGVIRAARIELPGLRLGSVAEGRLVARDRVVADGSELLLDGAAGVSEGAAIRVVVTRELIPEPGRAKLARCRVSDAPLAPGPDLRARIGLSGHAVREVRPHEADALEAAGWSEVLDEAITGEIAFPGGALRLSPTPAMALFDVDGSGDLGTLAVAAARAVGEAIDRLDITGSIGVDFPSVQGKALRNAVAEALDAALPPPFERTALNGFGFLQVVRPRPRASLVEVLRSDPVGAAARSSLRSLERTPPGTPLALRLPSAVRARIDAHPDWLAELTRRTGRPPQLES
ncbi:MAG: ribonuclease [Sphingomonas sp.]|nr:ribonuclease [Sphingomonas sp.]